MAKFIQDRVARVPTQNIRSSQGFVELALTGNHGLGIDAAQFQILEPNGSDRDVYLPPASVSLGAWFRIMNAGGGGDDLLVKTEPGGPTIMTIANLEAGFLVCNGVSWTPLL